MGAMAFLALGEGQRGDVEGEGGGFLAFSLPKRVGTSIFLY